MKLAFLFFQNFSLLGLTAIQAIIHTHSKGTIMSWKKLLIISACLLQAHNVFASQIIHCPSVDEIKNGSFTYWLPLYIEGEELASKSDVNKFREHVERFSVARWHNHYLEYGHCFYQGSDPIVEKITFAHDAWRPTNASVWIWRMPTLAECFAGNAKDCEFIT